MWVLPRGNSTPKCVPFPEKEPSNEIAFVQNVFTFVTFEVFYFCIHLAAPSFSQPNSHTKWVYVNESNINESLTFIVSFSSGMSVETLFHQICRLEIIVISVSASKQQSWFIQKLSNRKRQERKEGTPKHTHTQPNKWNFPGTHLIWW